MKYLPVLFLAVLIAFVPTVARAQEGNEDRGVLVRVDGDVTVAAGERFRLLVVINGDARVDGTVKDLVVVDGDATVSGQVENDAVVVEGSLTLTRTARVKDVRLVRSDLNQEAGASIAGNVSRRDNFRLLGGLGFLFTFLFWLGMTIVVLAGGLLFAAVGGRQLNSAASLLTDEIGKSILSAVVVWVGLPIVAVVLMVTVIGIPLGIGLLLFLLPSLAFLGYVVGGTRVGLAIVGLGGRSTGDHPYLATLVGLLILQVLLFVPVLGFLISALVGLWGTGGLALHAWRAARGTTSTDQQSAAPSTAIG